MLAGLLVVCLQLSACTQDTAGAESKAEPAQVEHVEGSDISRLTLTAKAAERLGVQTTTIRQTKSAGTSRTVIPYGTVLYDAKGATWVYVAQAPLSFVRERVTIEYIKDGQAVLTDGPAIGTAVVTVGAAELYGTEFGVGH